LKEDTPSVKVVDTLRAIEPRAWNALAVGHPFLRHEFLHALHETGCACETTGWSPRYLTLWQGASLVGAMPLYAKSHSYGEYVFDWAWADAYHRHGLSYYPKLLGAIPFSPVTGPRLLARDGETRALLVRAALRLSLEVSSLHVLFPTEPEAREMETAGMMLRRSVQFHWENRGYANFDEFLSDLASAKRKKIRQERRRVQEAGVRTRRLVGAEIRDEDWSFFTRCYNSTYRAHHSTPYLNLEFFRRLGKTLPEHLLMVFAEIDGKPIASALNIFSPLVSSRGARKANTSSHGDSCRTPLGLRTGYVIRSSQTRWKSFLPGSRGESSSTSTSWPNGPRSGQKTRRAYLFLGKPQSSAATWRGACWGAAGRATADVARAGL
jgi:predicted N-acyltransferase